MTDPVDPENNSADPWELTAEEQRALELNDRRPDLRSKEEAAWFDRYIKTHPHPFLRAGVHGRECECALGVGLGGAGYRCGPGESFFLASGPPEVAGCWSFAIWQEVDERGWHRGWHGCVRGSEAYAAALSIRRHADADDSIGPFHDEADLLHALCVRLVALLTLATESAIAVIPMARARQEAQRASAVEAGLTGVRRKEMRVGSEFDELRRLTHRAGDDSGAVPRFEEAF